MKSNNEFPFSYRGPTLTANMVPEYDDGYFLHLSGNLTPTLSELLLLYEISPQHSASREMFERQWKRNYVIQEGTGIWRILTSAALLDLKTGLHRGVSHGTIHELRHTPPLRKKRS